MAYYFIKNCYRERFTSLGIKLKIKYPCGQCQSCADSKNAKEIKESHVKGKFCKKGSQQCARCQKRKTLNRIVKHLAGGPCGRRCEACRGGSAWLFQRKYRGINSNMPRHLKTIYIAMLSKKIYSYFDDVICRF